MPCKTASKENIQKIHIHIFHNKLMGGVAIILDVICDCDIVKRAKVILAKSFGINTSTK